jgi:predicted dehydrogenase
MTRLRVGIVGAGHISQTHLRAWRQAPGCELTAICDRDRAAAVARARGLSGLSVVDDLEALLELCDVVDVCTPPQSHAAIAQRVVESGRQLLIEKPVVIEIEDWHRLRSSVMEHGTHLCVVHNIKFSRAILKAMRWVAEGRIGRVLRLHRQFMTHPDFDRMLTATHHWSHELPGGRWFETLPHALYLTHALIGPLELEHVSGLATARAPRGAPVDEVSISLKGETCLATIDYSAHSRMNRRRLRLEGTEGVIEVDVLGDSAILYRGGDAKWKRPWGSGLRDSTVALIQWAPDRIGYVADRIGGRSPHSRLIHAFARHLQGEGPSPTPIEEIDYVVTMCDRLGRAIDASRHG